MKRTQISLDPEERALLDAESHRTGRSMSALIRDAVRVAYAPADDASADLRRLDDALGTWSSQAHPDDGEAYVDALRTGTRWERL